MIRNILIKLFVMIPLCICQGVYANNPDRIYLQADNVTYDYKKGIVHYEGSVQAKQGVTQLDADQMILYYNANHKIEKIVALGKLARYQTLLNDNKDLLKASARTIYYYPIAEKVILETQAKIDYNQNSFSGPAIFYNMRTKVIASHPQKNSQSKIVLEPIKQLKTELK